MHTEKSTAAGTETASGSLMLNSALSGSSAATGHYGVQCIGADGKVKWEEPIENVVTQEGKVVALHTLFKGSAFTQASYLGLITSTGYTGAPVAANTAANISTSSAAGNGWQEAPASVAATRGTPSWGTAAGAGGNGSLATGSAVSFSILAEAVLKGCFVLVKSAAGVAPTTAPGNTTGALYSAGLFTGGDKPVSAGDTLNVTYTANLT
jgi:hypothetical protein